MANENPACCAEAKATSRRVLVVGSPIKAAEENPERKKLFFQNRGPGIIFLHPGKETTFPTLPTIRVAVNDFYADDPPWVHCSEWWVDADTANTDIAILEWA